jgi:hypothetical protein
MNIAAGLSEIYTTKEGVVYQCDRQNRVLVNFAGSATVLKVDAFLRLQKAAESIDLEEMATSTARCTDFEILAVCGCDRCYVLTLAELYAFKDLLNGAKFAMELNSLLHDLLDAQLA